MHIFSSSLETGDNTPSVADSEVAVAQQFVRLDKQSLSDLSDSDLNTYIHTCCARLMEAHKRYQDTGCFAAAGDRDAWLHAEASALIERGNRPHVVSRMERDLGLR